MKARSRLFVQVWIVLLLSLMSVPSFGQLTTKIDRESSILYGFMQSVNPETQQVSILDTAGKARVIAYNEGTIIFSDFGPVHYLHFHQGNPIFVRCQRKIIPPVHEDNGFCPLVIVADRIYLNSGR